MQYTSFFYSVPYIFFVLLLGVLSLAECFLDKNNIQKKGLLLFTYLIVLVFIGLRGFVYSDWISYYAFYNVLPSLSSPDLSWFLFDSMYSNWELGFNIYSVLCRSVFPDYHWWIAFSTLIDLLILYSFLNLYVKNQIFGLLLFIAFSGLGLEFNLLRNVKAILIFLFAIRFIQERRPIPYFVTIAIACLFHITSVIYFPLYFILNRKYDKKCIVFLFLLGLIVFFLRVEYIKTVIVWFVSMFDSRLNRMVEDYFVDSVYSQQRVLSIGFIERFFSFAFLMIMRDKLIEKSCFNIIFFNAFVIYLFSYLYLSELTILTDRISLLFVFSYWVLYANVFDVIKNRQLKLLFFLGVVSYSVLRVMADNSHILAQYDNLLFGIQDFESRSRVFFTAMDKLMN